MRPRPAPSGKVLSRACLPRPRRRASKRAGERVRPGSSPPRREQCPPSRSRSRSVKTSFGEFAAHLEKSGPSEPPLQSDFVASNSVLSAALSKPVNEGSGVYSVTAMLNPPRSVVCKRS